MAMKPAVAAVCEARKEKFLQKQAARASRSLRKLARNLDKYIQKVADGKETTLWSFSWYGRRRIRQIDMWFGISEHTREDTIGLKADKVLAEITKRLPPEDRVIRGWLGQNVGTLIEWNRSHTGTWRLRWKLGTRNG